MVFTGPRGRWCILCLDWCREIDSASFRRTGSRRCTDSTKGILGYESVAYEIWLYDGSDEVDYSIPVLDIRLINISDCRRIVDGQTRNCTVALAGSNRLSTSSLGMVRSRTYTGFLSHFLRVRRVAECIHQPITTVCTVRVLTRWRQTNLAWFIKCLKRLFAHCRKRIIGKRTCFAKELFENSSSILRCNGHGVRGCRFTSSS